ncbi:MAG TPA: DinB family protein [Gemmatimonadaceae bacterium]|nr:DinB family protein [Gemmatimonadaceae bacterium]
MTATVIAHARETKPGSDEFLEYYARYISLVADGDVVSALAAQMKETQALLRGMPASKGTYRYGPDKWSVNQMLGHMIDAERIFGSRALRFARNDPTPVPGFEQDDYVRGADFDACALRDLAAELESVRVSTIFFYKHLTEEAWLRRGIANGASVSVRALAYITAGHELHHRSILRERYL